MAVDNYPSSSQRIASCRVLGLEPTATREEIKSAYKQLALKWHPDRQKSQKEYAKDRFVEIHEAYQTLMTLTPATPRKSRDTSGFTSPPSTPVSKPSNFYSQSAGSSTSWASSGSSSNASTPRTSTDELPTPKPSKHTRTHSKTSTDGFRRARTRTLSRVKKSDRAHFTRTESSGSGRSHNSSKSHGSSSRHHHSSRSHKSERSEPSSSHRSHSSKDKGKEKHSSSKPSHYHSSERSSDRSDRSDRDDHHHRHRSHRHRSRSRSRSRSRDRSERSEPPRHADRGKERERERHNDAKVEEPEVKKEKAEKKPTKLHRKVEKESEPAPKEKMEKVEEVDDLPPQTSEAPLRPPIIGIPLRPSHAPDTNNSDWIFPLPLTLEELFSGTNYRFQITRRLRNFPKPDSHPTSTPKSTHASLDDETNTSTIHINVDIPPGGYKNMTQMRFEGIGNQRKSDGSFQDIVFVVQEVLHDRFIRIQDDLVARIELTWDEALEKEDVILVDGLDGEKIEVPIPKVPDDSKETRIPKAGMPTRNAKDEVVGRGDLVIRWEFVFPQKQSSSKWRALKSKFSWQSPKATAS